MLVISRCPECGRPVTVPEQLHLAVLARCPVCDGQFCPGELVLDSATAEGYADAPPRLTLLGIPPASVASAESCPPDEASDTFASGEDEPAAEPEQADEWVHEAGAEIEQVREEDEQDPLVRSPHDSTEFRLSEMILGATGLPLGPATAAAMAKYLSPDALGEGSQYGLEDGFEFLDHGVEASPRFGFGATREADDAERPTAVSPRPRRKKQGSLVREFVGIVLGGVGGLVLAYYGLNFFSGKERFNFLNIYLPGVEHTAKYRPEWWPTWGSEETVFREDTADSSVTQQALRMTPEDLPDVEGGLGFPPVGSEGDLPMIEMFGPSGLEQPTPPPPGPAAQTGLAPADVSIGLPPDLLQATPPQNASAEELRAPARPPTVPAAEMNVDVPDVAEQSEPEGEAKGFDGGKIPPEIDSEASAETGHAGLDAQLVNLSDAPPSTRPDLATAIAAARHSLQPPGQPGFGTKGQSDEDGEPATGASQPVYVLGPAAYERMCLLAQAITMAEDISEERESAGQNTAAYDLLTRVGQSKENVRAIAQLAVEHLETGRPSSGLLFAGKVEAIDRQGEIHTATIKMASIERRIELRSRESLDLEPQDRVLVLGSLADEPSGDVPEAAAKADGSSVSVWHGMLVTF